MPSPYDVLDYSYEAPFIQTVPSTPEGFTINPPTISDQLDEDDYAYRMFRDTHGKVWEVRYSDNKWWGTQLLKEWQPLTEEPFIEVGTSVNFYHENGNHLVTAPVKEILTV